MSRSPRWIEVQAVLAYVRSRRLHRLVLLAALAAAAATLARSTAVVLPLHRAGLEFAVPITTLVPALIAVLLSSGLHSPMPALEQTAVRRMHLVRLVTITSIAAIGACLAVGPALVGQDSGQAVTAVRNLAGFLGLTLLTGASIGYGLAWLLPLASLGLTVVYGVDPANHPYQWAWSLMPATAPSSWLFALVLLASGAALSTLRSAEPAAQHSA